MLLINRFLLSKYSRPIFSASIAVFLKEIVQNINRGLYFVMRKLFLLENCTGRKNGFTLYLHSAKVLQTYLCFRANL